jgi:hypothetical protein
MKKWIVIACVAVLFFFIGVGAYIGHRVGAQQKPLVATDLEMANLGIKYRDVQLAQVSYTQAQAVFQKTVDDFNGEVEAIKKAHSWPADVTLDKDAITKREFKFVRMPVTPSPAPPGKKP